MTQHIQTDEAQNSPVNIGVCIALGFIFGQLLLDGNITLGLALGLVVWAIGEDLGHKPVYTLSGLMVGTGLGALLGASLGLLVTWVQGTGVDQSFGQIWQLLRAGGYFKLGAYVGLAVGMVIGAVIDTRTGGKERHDA
jgi:hypothetical protein